MKIHEIHAPRCKKLALTKAFNPDRSICSRQASFQQGLIISMWKLVTRQFAKTWALYSLCNGAEIYGRKHVSWNEQCFTPDCARDL
ncbi:MULTISPECIES: hypothetical protein [unclassified Janthinobacterium]|uniref:hypothetical protein n=1 Tax=unclassified Janthinobacterium TaxID=2610881 RepID=UPI0018CAD4E7|nr:hypothetical protein [Janthinobacterium sp. CG_23.4]MDH6155910.1 hypothetical protein [Janthinobacterium sp. CG_23.4]